MPSGSIFAGGSVASTDRGIAISAINSANNYDYSLNDGISSYLEGFGFDGLDLEKLVKDNREAELVAALEQFKLSQTSADKAMQFEADQAALNRTWQEMMSNTAYQRSVSDMKAAGLNPILAAQNGGASTPSGSSARGVSASAQKANVDTSSFVNAFSSILSSATSVYNLRQQLISQGNISDAKNLTSILTTVIGSSLKLLGASN